MLWAVWQSNAGALARRRLLLATCLMLCGGLLACRGGVPTAFGAGQRYLFVPFALYVCALLSAWSQCRRNEPTQIYPLILLLVIGYHSSEHFLAPRYPAADWPAACRLLQAGQAVEITVAPLGARVTILPDRGRRALPP
jgi:hypothetical protein